MNFLGGIIGDAMKEGPSGLVGGIVGNQIKKDPRGLIGGLAGEMIDDPRRAIGGLAGAALGGNFGGGMKGLVDTKERIFRDGRIFSRPKGGGPVHGPDNRRFTPDPNPYDVEPETPRYGEGSVEVSDLRGILNRLDYLDEPDLRNMFNRPGVEREPGIGVDPSKLDMTPYINPDVPMPPATEEDVQRYKFLMGPHSPLAGNFLDAFMSDRGLLEQNKEVMGPKEQVFPRFADPGDGTLKNPMMVAAGPSFEIPREVSPQQVREINRRVISDYDRKKEMLRRGLLAPLLRGV